MRVLHAAAEAFPLLKTGGLADVVGALPAVLRAQGADVRLVLPGIPAIRDGMLEPETIARIGPAFGAAQLSIRRGRMPDTGLPVYVVDAPWLFEREGNPYVGPDGLEWHDNYRRFAAFGWAAAHLAFGEFDSTWRADILHSHDWHAGLSAAYLQAHPARRVRTVFTIHNLAYQGRLPLDEFRELQLPSTMLNAEGLEFHGYGSFMKSGLVFSDRLTTVSPRYAGEICTPEFGAGLDGVLRARRDRLSGILNGVDYGLWNPATDPYLPAHYSRDDFDGKARCKAQLQTATGLTVADRVPLFTTVSRMTDQKGTDLLLSALPELLRRGGQLMVLGSGDRYLEEGFVAAARANPGSVHVKLGYDEPMAHRMIAAADVILVPSRFEPCGLTQMYGLRYGTLPLVRRVGGLADTVTDEALASAESPATGFVFDAASGPALEAAIARAVSVYSDRSRWSGMMRVGMARDHSWAAAAAQYMTLYRELVAGQGPKPSSLAAAGR